MAMPRTGILARAAADIAARSVHIKMYPTARSMPERREVLRVLRRFGEVETFKSLKYDPLSPVPNAFLSILDNADAARRAIDASPIRYRLILEGSGESKSESESLQPSSSASTTSDPTLITPTHTPTPTSIAFELRISPSLHPHALVSRSSPLHGPYTPVSTRRSPIAADLASRIPSSIQKPGLCDWTTDAVARGGAVGGSVGGSAAGGSMPWRLRRGAAVQGSDTGRAPASKEEKRWRQRRVMPSVMRGLRKAEGG